MVHFIVGRLLTVSVWRSFLKGQFVPPEKKLATIPQLCFIALVSDKLEMEVISFIGSETELVQGKPCLKSDIYLSNS